MSDTITLQVGKKEFELPSKLNIKQYKEIRKIENFGKSPIEFIVAISGLDQDEVRYSNKKDMDFVYRFLIQKYFGEQDTKLKTEFEYKGVQYGLMTDISQLNWGGWVDLEFLTTDGVEKNIERIMALIYRPIISRTKKGYIIEEYDHDTMLERAELFENLPMDYFWGATNFFFHLVKELNDVMKNSLEYQKVKKKAMRRLRWLNPKFLLWKVYQGFTGPALWSFVKKTSQKLKKLLNNLWSYVLTIYLWLKLKMKNIKGRLRN
jgi:hypothetical protein